jgi:hypothetical protein
MPIADNNRTSPVTPAEAAVSMARLLSRSRIAASSGRALRTASPASMSAAIAGSRAASGPGLPRRRTLSTSGEIAPGAAA